jgi:hypothetical protein
MGKRARHSPKTVTTPASTSAFHYELVAVSKNYHRGISSPVYAISATFSIPAEDEECPLTLDLISDSTLPFLPEKTPFLLDRPMHSKLTLPCGHAFSAMTLLYSFCKNNMTCPCCRSGSGEKMDIHCLPKHLRTVFQTQLQETLDREAREDQQDNLLAIAGFVFVQPYLTLAANDRLSLQMEFFNIPVPLPLHTRLTSIFCMTTSLTGSGSGTDISLQPRTDLRGISNIAHMGVNAVRLSVILTLSGVGRVPVDASSISMLPQANDEVTPRSMSIAGISNLTVTQMNGLDVLIQLNSAGNNNDNNANNGSSTRFSIHFAQSAAFAHLLIRNIVWHPGAETIAVISNNGGLASSIYN